MRILILRGGALGDFLVTLPALQLLRHHWPAARIELVGNTRAAELATVAGLLDQAYSQHEARWSALFNDEALPRPLASWLDEFDLIINYWPDVDGTVRRHFAHRGNAFLSSHARPTTSPAARHFCAVLKALGFETDDFRARLVLPATLHEEAAQRLGGFSEFIAFHPGSGAPAKNWPVERWLELGAKLRKPILAITGEADRMEIAWPEDLFIERAHEWPLPILAAALTRANRYYGHDTGISHLAAAVGTPCVLLFGPTDPEMWAPVGENVRVIKRGSSMSLITVEHVLETSTSQLEGH